MKLEISVNHIATLSELAKRYYSLSGIDDYENDREVDDYLYEKSLEFSSILDFLEDPEKYISEFERHLKQVEAEMETL